MFCKGVVQAIVLLVSLTGIQPSYAQKLSRHELRAINTTPEEIASKATIMNDNLDTIIEVNTRTFHKRKPGLFSIGDFDKFMRALIDKKTGDTTYQVYFWIVYVGDKIDLQRLNYFTPDGPETAKTRKILKKKLGCRRHIGCWREEHIAADIPEAVLRDVAADAQAGEDRQWHVRLYGPSSEGWTTGLLKTEIAGFLIAVDQVKAKLRSTATALDTH